MGPNDALGRDGGEAKRRGGQALQGGGGGCAPNSKGGGHAGAAEELWYLLAIAEAPAVDVGCGAAALVGSMHAGADAVHLSAGFILKGSLSD